MCATAAACGPVSGTDERGGYQHGAEPLPGRESRLGADSVSKLSGALWLHTLERQQRRVQASHQRLAARERECLQSADGLTPHSCVLVP